MSSTEDKKQEDTTTSASTISTKQEPTSSTSFEINILPSMQDSAKFAFSVTSDQSVLVLKELLSKRLGIPLANLRLIFTGKILKDQETVGECKLQPGSTVHVVKMGTSSTSGTVSNSTTTSQPIVPGAGPTQIPATQFRQQVQQQNAAGGAVPPGAFRTAPGTRTHLVIPPGAASFGALPPNHPAANFLMNPEMIRAITEFASSNPQMFASLMQANPQFRSMPPEMQQMMMNPEFLRMMLNMGQYAGGAGPTGATGLGAQFPRSVPQFPQPAATDDENTIHTPPNQAEMEQMQAILDAMARSGTISSPYASTAPVPTSPSEPPEIRFQTQLAQLNEMGFWDPEENIRVLLQTGGNVAAAIERLLQTNPPGGHR